MRASGVFSEVGLLLFLAGRHRALILVESGVTIPLLTITFVRTLSFSIYSAVKESLVTTQLLSNHTVGGTALLGLAGGAASGTLLSVGTCAFEFGKVKQRKFLSCSTSIFCGDAHHSRASAELEYLIAVQRKIPYKPSGTLRGFVEVRPLLIAR